MKFLITGFEPFGGEKINPSFEAVQLLPAQMEGINITKVRLPVSFARAGKILYDAIDGCRPDAVICVGQAGGYTGIAVERIAVNLQDASLPNNDGVQPIDRPVIAGGPDGYFSALPVKGIVKELQNRGIPAFVSNSAGTYVCNTVMYTLLDRVHHEERPMIGGFIHVPYTAEQAAGKNPGTPGMELTMIAEGLIIAIRASARAQKAVSR